MKAGLAYLRLRITNCHMIIRKHLEALLDVSSKLREILDVTTLDILDCTVRSKTQWETQQRRSRHANKLAKIIPAGSTPDPNTMEDKWVLNLSNRILSETEKSALSLWP